MSPDIKYVGLIIALFTFFAICRRFYLDWRTDKWRELTGMSWDETYNALEYVLLAWEDRDMEIRSHVTNGDVECGHFFIEIDNVKFKITLGKHSIKSWKEYRKYKKENSNTFYILKTMPTLNSKSKVIARYETLENFVTDFPNISSLYVKQGKTEDRIDKLMEDF